MTPVTQENSMPEAIIDYVRENHHLVIAPHTAQWLEKEMEAEAISCEIEGCDMTTMLP